MSKSNNQKYFSEKEPRFKKVSIKRKSETKNYLKSIREYRDAVKDSLEEEYLES